MARAGVYRDPTIVTARPVVPGPIAEFIPPEALTAGSQINESSEGGPYKASPLAAGSSLDVAQDGAPWPAIINGAVKFFNSWRPNALREISNHNVAGNYGSETGKVNFGWRRYEFDGYDAGKLLGGSQAGYPGTDGSPYTPTWNSLVPIIYGLRVLNPVAGGNDNYKTLPQSVVSQFTAPTQFTPTGTAALAGRGLVLQ